MCSRPLLIPERSRPCHTHLTHRPAAARFGHGVFRIWLAATLIAAIATWVGFGALAGLKHAANIEGRQVLTASMEPFMPVGSYVFAKRADGLATSSSGKPVVIKTDQGVVYTHRSSRWPTVSPQLRATTRNSRTCSKHARENVIGVPFAVVRGPAAIVLSIISDVRNVIAVSVVLILTPSGRPSATACSTAATGNATPRTSRASPHIICLERRDSPYQGENRMTRSTTLKTTSCGAVVSILLTFTPVAAASADRNGRTRTRGDSGGSADNRT